MSSQTPTADGHPAVKPWIRYGLLVLVAEKIVQHVFVTLSFIFDFFGIRATVAVDYNYLLYSGAVITLLFGLALWVLWKNQRWGINLVLVLALCDIVGEFIAQGGLFITINVSFLVAIALLVWVWFYKRGLRRQPKPV